MRILKIVFFVILGILFFSACEKDDICIDGDIPLLVVEFFDMNDTTMLKDVPELTVEGFIEPDSVLPIIPNTSASSVSLPLRTDESSTSFIFSRRLTANDSIQSDTVTFSYETKENFVSRACGRIVTFDGLQGSVGQEDSLWINEIRIDTLFVDNTVNTNVKILH